MIRHLKQTDEEKNENCERTLQVDNNLVSTWSQFRKIEKALQNYAPTNSNRNGINYKSGSKKQKKNKNQHHRYMETHILYEEDIIL